MGHLSQDPPLLVVAGLVVLGTGVVAAALLLADHVVHRLRPPTPVRGVRVVPWAALAVVTLAAAVPVANALPHEVVAFVTSTSVLVGASVFGVVKTSEGVVGGGHR